MTMPPEDLVAYVAHLEGEVAERESLLRVLARLATDKGQGIVLPGRVETRLRAVLD